MSNEFSTMTTAQLREYMDTIQAEEAALAVVLEVFPVRIRSEAQIANIHHTYKVATLMAETMKPTPEFGAEVIAQWTAMGTDDCLAMAAAYRAWLAGR